MAVTVSAVDLKGLRAYSLKNPIKFKHKYGDIDFNNVPEQMNTVGGIALYKGFVTKERVRRELSGISQEDPITPWMLYKPAPKPVEVVASTAQTVGEAPVGTVTTTA